MADEKLEQNVNENETNEYQTYIDTINDLKANSVSKDKYDQLKQENKSLIDALKNGQQIEVEEEAEVDIDQLRKDLFDTDKPLTNLEYVSKSLQLRNAILEKEGVDIFLPNGHNYKYDSDDKNKADYVAQMFQECIDYADGDSQLFTQELMRRTKDDTPMQKTKFR